MKNVKFTGVNIAAALLVIAFFFPWVTAMGTMSLSGFSITSTGISPGMLSMFLKGFDRLLMVLIIVVPLSGALILYQHITGNQKFNKYYRPAHFIPVVVLLAGMIMIYFKMKPEMPADIDGYSMRETSRMVRNLTPGLFDILGVGVYLSLAAAVYLVLAITGKITDKEYFKQPAPATTVSQESDQGAH